MKMDLSIKGINSLNDHGAGRRISRATGVSDPVISALKHGKRGIGLKDARKLAPAFETNKPVALYVLSQKNAIKGRIENGERAAALRGAAVVLEELQKIPPEELGAEGDELLDAVKALEKIIADSLTGEPDDKDDEAPAKPKAAKKSRRDPFGKKVGTEGSGEILRDAYGKRLK